MEDKFKIEIVDAWYIEEGKVIATKGFKMLESYYGSQIRNYILKEDGWFKIDADEVVYSEAETAGMVKKYNERWKEIYTRWAKEYADKAAAIK